MSRVVSLEHQFDMSIEMQRRDASALRRELEVVPRRVDEMVRSSLNETRQRELLGRVASIEGSMSKLGLVMTNFATSAESRITQIETWRDEYGLVEDSDSASLDADASPEEDLEIIDSKRKSEEVEMRIKLIEDGYDKFAERLSVEWAELRCAVGDPRTLGRPMPSWALRLRDSMKRQKIHSDIKHRLALLPRRSILPKISLLCSMLPSGRPMSPIA